MLNPGQVLCDRYLLQHNLGQIAGRRTWLALDQASQPPVLVIIKFLAFVDQVNWDMLKLFEREANILQQLHHPAIPQYRDYFSIDDRVLWFGLVQEYIPGQSLSELIQQGKRFSLERVQQIAVDLLEILIYLHGLTPSVFHRDIKPSNLILDERDRIFLIDFGAVQDRAAVVGSTFTVVGTYGYAPMEQFGGQTVAASDLYSLGATLIHLLTGVSPADLPRRNAQIQFADQVNLPASFAYWLQTMTHPDVAERFETAQAALVALQNPHPPNEFIRSSVASYKSKPKHRIPVIINETPMELKITCWPKQYTDRKILQYVFFLMIGIGLISIPLQAIATGINLIVFGLFALGIVSLFGMEKPQPGDGTRLTFRRFGMFSIKKNSRYVEIGRDRTETERVSNIQDIVQHEWKSRLRITQRVITIQTAKHDFSFGQHHNLTREECQWIVQTMRRWLFRSGIKTKQD